jgi:5S rRNA maturation endonuclease (ribonuclease M5)
VLDYRPTNLELVPNVIITEGKNDYYTYNYIQTIINEGKKYYLIPGTSSSNLETLISLYLGWGRKFIVLLDSDKEGIKQKKRYAEIYGDSIKDLIHIYSDIKSTWLNFETEDLFTFNDKIKLQSNYYPEETKYIKKTLNRSIQELYINNITIELENETKINFKTVFKYFEEKLR